MPCAGTAVEPFGWIVFGEDEAEEDMVASDKAEATARVRRSRLVERDVHRR